MNGDGPIPLSAQDIPEGARPWRLEDGERWRAVETARWARPLWAVLALLATAIHATATVPGTVCTDAAPCGPEWWGFALFGAGLLLLHLLFLYPGAALLLLAPVLALVLLEPGALGDADATARLAVVLAGLFAAAGLQHRREVSRRQAALATEAAGGVRHRAPLDPHTSPGGRIALAVAAFLLLVAGAALWQALAGIDRDEARAARATAYPAQVTARGEDSLTVTLPGGESRTVSVAYPEDYAEGATIGVLVDGDWARTVAEPYDPFGWQLVILLTALPGAAALLHRAATRRRTAALLTGPQPVLRVLAAEGRDDSRTYVFAFDDRTASRPLLSFYGWPEAAPEDADPEAMAEEMREALRGGDDTWVLRDAVLYGAPGAGSGLAVVMAGTRTLTVERALTGVRPERGPAVPRPRRTGTTRRRSGAPGRATHRAPAPAETAATLTPVQEPRRWSAGGVSRAVGVFLLLFNAGCLWLLLHDGAGLNWFLLLGLPSAVNMTVCALSWRVTADAHGLWVTGPWRVHRIAWDDLTAVRADGDALRFSAKGRPAVNLPITGFRALEHRLHGTSGAERARNEIRALHEYPTLRPPRDASAREQGFALGPVIAVLIAAWSALVLLL
ncbi:hypothetical protein ACFV5N_15185 [Streptomyces sp. NPDC059853]|uniref:hypothetical protein n=1 Tax=Streptomyces sp. NPDC059853 TaxID=3346973 RepID=UPI003653E590